MLDNETWITNETDLKAIANILDSLLRDQKDQPADASVRIFSVFFVSFVLLVYDVLFYWFILDIGRFCRWTTTTCASSTFNQGRNTWRTVFGMNEFYEAIFSYHSKNSSQCPNQPVYGFVNKIFSYWTRLASYLEQEENIESSTRCHLLFSAFTISLCHTARNPPRYDIFSACDSQVIGFKFNFFIFRRKTGMLKRKRCLSVQWAQLEC